MKSEWFKHILGVTGIFLVATVQAQTTERVSVNSFGVQGNGDSPSWPAISADGRFVAFGSSADNLIPGDTNGLSDVFVHDRHTGTTERVSVDSHGNEGNGNCFGRPSLSADGRFVSFATLADNLSSQDTNSAWDVYVHDRNIGITELISVGIDGMAAGSSPDTTINADGRFVAFKSFADNLVSGDSLNTANFFVRDRLLGVTERVSMLPDGSQIDTSLNVSCCEVSISANGRFVSFFSLVLGEQDVHIVVHDRVLDATTRVSVADDGSPGNDHSFSSTISADGRWVAFSSDADNLVAGDTNNDLAAINALEAFIAEVEAQSGNKISEADALLLIAAARQIIALIEFT